MQHLTQNQSIHPANNSPTAKFAMSRLEFGASGEATDPLSAPPYEISQDSDAYNIYFNMYGIPETDIRVRLDPILNKFTVFAEREKRNFTDQFIWIFSLPSCADVGSVQTYYKKGVVQFMFPKRLAA